MLTTVDILIVEDDPDDRLLMSRALTAVRPMLGRHAARDGAECLQLIDAGLSPRLILLDLNMPRVNGYEVIRHLCLNDSARARSVVVFTTHGGDHAELQASGIIAQVRKPDRYSELVELFRSQLDGWLVQAQAQTQTP